MRIHVDDQSTCMLLNASAAKANTRELMKKAKAFVARETVLILMDRNEALAETLGLNR